MANDRDIEAKFWKALQSDKTMMVGLDGVEAAHPRPMTAMLEPGDGPIWFFTAIDTELVKALPRSNRAVATFASKGHDVFATVKGRLRLDNDRAVIDRLWNPFIAAWYPGGKDDPKLALLRLDGETAEIWLNDYSLLAGLKMLFGADPKQEYKDKVAVVDLG